MKKGLLLILALAMALGTAWAQVDDSYRPLKPAQLAQVSKYPYATSNFFMCTSTDRGLTYGAKIPITTFNYAVDGGWIAALSHSEILVDGVPAMSFAGGDDVPDNAQTVNVWFWSAATGLVTVASRPFTNWYADFTSISQEPITGDLYISWSNNDCSTIPGDIFIAKSTDKGATWSESVNVSTLIRAYTPNDTCMLYPKLAPRSVGGLHLLWLDDSQDPGSAVQGIGVYDTAFVKYAKISLALDAVMPLATATTTEYVINFGTSAYDWATTGCTQGIVVNDEEYVAAVFTKGGLLSIPTGLSSREVHYVSFIPGYGQGPDISLDAVGQYVGFPGISLGPDNNPAFVWHHGGDKRIYAQLDNYGIGGGQLMSAKLGKKNPGDNYIWPSAAYIGGANAGDSIAWTGNYSAGNYNGVRRYICPTWSNNVMSISGLVDPDFDINGTGTYDGILASPIGTNKNMWSFFCGSGAIWDVPNPPTIDTFLNVYAANPLIPGTFTPDNNYMSIFAPRLEYSLTQQFWIGTWDYVFTTRLYHKVNTAGTWSVLKQIDFAKEDTCSEDPLVWTTTTDTVFFNNLAYSTALTDTNYYYVTNEDAEGESDSGEVFMECMGTVISGVTGDRLAASPAFKLNQSWPNPVRDNATISFSLPRSGTYSLKVYNVAGQVVRTISGSGNAGMNTVNVNGRNLSNGVYFYQLNAAGSTATKKMVVLK